MILHPGVLGRAYGQAGVGGRMNLFFREARMQDTYLRTWVQDLSLTMHDDLFVKNRIALSYLLERRAGTTLTDVFLKQRIRATVTGVGYAFSGDYTPPHAVTASTRESSQRSRRARFSLGIRPEGLPTFSASFDRGTRWGEEGESRIHTTSEDKLATVSYERTVASVRGTYRERSTTGGTSIEESKTRREGLGGVTLEGSLGRIASATLSYDGLVSREEVGELTRSTVRIDNLKGLLSSYPTRWIALTASFLGTVIRRENGDPGRIESKQVYAAASILPFDYLTVRFARDVREKEEAGERSLSDYARAEAVAQGYVRAGVKGRASVQRTFVVRSREGAFPANGYFLNLDSDLLPGARLAFDVGVTQTERPTVQTGRLQVRKGVDLRCYPRSNILLSSSCRTLQRCDKLDLVGTKTYDIEFDLTYRPKPRLAAVLTVTRSVDKAPVHRRGLYLSNTVTYSLKGGSHLALVYVRRDTGAAAQTASGPATQGSYPNNYLLELVLMLARRTRLSVKYDIKDLAAGGTTTVLGVAFLTSF